MFALLSRLLFACAVTFVSASAAHAQSAPDTVFLKNGGRVRGNIQVEDPKAGVTIQLTDGSVRTVPAASVARVEYGAPTSAPAGYAPAAPAAPTGQAYGDNFAPYQGGYMQGPVPPPGGMYMREPHYHRRGGLIATGIAAMVVGAIGLAIGGGLLADDDDNEAAPPLMVGGGVLFSVGVPLFIIGMIKVRDNNPYAPYGAADLESVPRPALSLLPSMLSKDAFGLRLAGTL